MALKNCPECGNKVSDLAKICPNCGYPLKEKLTEKSNAKNNNNIKRANGMGTVFKLSGNRRKPYVAKERMTLKDGNQKVIGYFKTRQEAVAALEKYYEKINKITDKTISFSELYNIFCDLYLKDKDCNLAEGTKKNYENAYKKCKLLYDMPICMITRQNIDKITNTESTTESTRIIIKNLINQLIKFARNKGLSETDFAPYREEILTSIHNDTLTETQIIENEFNRIDVMDGHRFEYWCADLLKKNDYINVEVTKGSGDQGVDVIAEKEDIRFAIQCKCQANNLSNKPIQEINAGRLFYKCQIGVVMTNRYFTEGAKELAMTTGVLLWDRDKIKKLLSNIIIPT